MLVGTWASYTTEADKKMKGCDTNEQKKKGDLHGINTEQDYEKRTTNAHICKEGKHMKKGEL